MTMPRGTIRKIIAHGQIVGRPTRQPAGTANSVGYELGKCFQLDRTHCLLCASLDEQGGGDMCVGNDGFIFTRLGDIQPENAFAINGPDPRYHLRRREGTAFLAKYPVTGGFVPLEARLDDGRPHPAAGTGILVAAGITFNPERTSADQYSETVVEFMQLRWDGHALTIPERTLVDGALGLTLLGLPLSYFCPHGTDFLAPFTTDRGPAVFRLAFDGRRWQIVDRGEPFGSHQGSDGIHPVGESEPSLLRGRDGFVLYTRGSDPVGRLYRSADGRQFTPWFQKPNQTVPQALNQGLDATLYLATNPNWDWLRNPLVVYPLVGEAFADAMVVHDQDGIRDDKGPCVPFIDHGVGVNLRLEGRWRHLLWYRVGDLKERTFHSYQAEVARQFHKDGRPRPRSTIGGLYLAELEYEHANHDPFHLEA